MTTANPNSADNNLPALRALEADIRAERFGVAVQALNRLKQVAPDDPRVHVLAARYAFATNDAEQEIAALKRAHELAPFKHSLLLDLAKAQSRAGQHEAAIETIDQAVSAVPQDIGTLEVAVAVANATHKQTVVRHYLQAALVLRPEDASIRKALAVCMEKNLLFTESEPLWRALHVEYPDETRVTLALGICLLRQNRHDEALPLLEQSAREEPDNAMAPFYLAVARRETPKTLPASMTRNLFDDYAERFDKHLVGSLGYRVPRRVAEMIRARHQGLDISLLDLGCGTGLVGVYLGKIGKAFVGVDLSSKMLDQARQHDVYTELRESDLLSALRETPAESFDYVTINDVLIYVGDISEVIPAAFAVLRPGGALIFSCEAADDSDGDYVLQPSDRYAHAPSYAKRLCNAAGFADTTLEMIDLRREGRQGVLPGFIVLAQK